MNSAKHWRWRAARYRLEGQRHRKDYTIRFPPEPGKPGEEADIWESYTLSGIGTVYSFSVVRQPPTRYEGQTPYIVALIRLEEGPLISAQLTDCDADQVDIGMPVEMVTRQLCDIGCEGLRVYAYKFRPHLITQNTE
ncbi:MAG: Zn-ribbon domain-containing OB-fold protein [Chloroflexi bacterium AL-W]|nr:Zn-ribbon domain-containing OB-fold protein [Chloroflexi bacterium AL-N1]NOK65051.1 Zn-ribbon domain-containing OB-fold protein [Chloroflexi bacterium AL-N10]NOK72682.1 Zn-ribbon domain-containing OB-fold protein [Chloroflexi bacterium AL-N5]NOK79230.1 Zn-ribbon domain-containing OB-fold protein [Chloroflexi bacterium AL-W]NOK87146.1 Zn-ribbon domain-containing OB-fold protein [Chloroflexi bacterium AL-N15]